MPVPILSDADIRSILYAPDEAINDRRNYADILHTTLYENAKTIDIRRRLWEARYHGRSTRFLFMRLPAKSELHNGTSIPTEDIINAHSVLDRFEQSCGKYVQASYDVEKGGHSILIYLEFVPPPKSILNPEDNAEVVEIPVAGVESAEDRALRKETSW